MSKPKDTQSILVMVVGLTVLGVWRFPILIYLAILIGILTLMSGRLEALILKAWFGLAKVLGYVNSRILLSLIYFVLLIPLSLLNKLIGNRTIQLKREHKESYFSVRNHTYGREDFEKPW